MWKPAISSDELWHHGVLGQKWGQRNGPPYPLSPGAHSAKEKKAGWRKSLNDGASSLKKTAKKNAIIKNENPQPKQAKRMAAEQYDKTEAAYKKLQEYNKHTDEWKKLRDKKFTINKDEKMKDAREQMSKSLKEIDEYFDNNPRLQEKLVKSAVDSESMYSNGAYQYLSNKVNNIFGDWYFGEMKSDRAKAAYNNYQKEMLKVDALEDKMAKIYRNRKVSKEYRKEYRELFNQVSNIRNKANLAVTKEAMKDIGLDASIYNDPEMQKKFMSIVIWD